MSQVHVCLATYHTFELLTVKKNVDDTFNRKEQRIEPLSSLSHTQPVFDFGLAMFLPDKVTV